MEKHRPDVRFVRAITTRASGHIAPDRRAVPVEAPLAVEVNDVLVAQLMRLPGHDAELALGFCYTEGLISGLSDVVSVEVCDEDTGRVRVTTPRPVSPRQPAVLTSACVGVRAANRDDLPPAVPTDGLPISAEVLLSAATRMQASQETHRAAGAVHAAAIFSPDGKLVVLREDVGRHNAIDKVVGYCLYHGCRPEPGILLSTGRASSEMVLKAAAARMPVAASRSGPTSLGVELAEQLGIALVCYLRRASMTVYAHPEHLTPVKPSRPRTTPP